ncbi:hypothetical protein PIGBHMHK_00620 [Mycoplasmopsis arginini]|uniref:hypothetical protein n=1 Tax=Mycoplasmopsis arginini TaxID=2094 RepID=UPI00249F8076|nr:hypothetical protein [Mycoplasmopsis arginini]MDI3348980.1 hypothetical protein [Mycoplasmopsis arginini]
MDLTAIFALLGTVDLAQFSAFVVFAFVGVILHVAVDIWKGNIVPKENVSFISTLLTYLFKDKVSQTLGMVSGVIALGTTYFAVTPQPVAWVTLIISAATAGYTSDSLFNRSSTAPKV